MGNAATNAASASKSDAKADAEARRKGMQQQEEDYGRFRAVRNALSSPGSAWYVTLNRKPCVRSLLSKTACGSEFPP